MRTFLTQAELTQRSGVARATVTRAERGDEIVTLTNISKLAEALDITPDELLTSDSDPRR
jgi:transcriptional regulator with XRE-family HTH domain